MDEMDQFANHSYPYTASPQPYDHHPFQPHPQRSYSAGSSISLQVSTTNEHGQEIDPLEYTARPSNTNPSLFNMEPTPTQRHPSYPLPLGGDLGVSQLSMGTSSEGSSSGAVSASNADSPRGIPSKSKSRSTSFNLTPLTRPLNQHEQERLAQLDRLKFFLATAPSRWDDLDPNDPSTSDTSDPGSHSHLDPANPHPALNRFLLPSNEYVSCVLWSGLYHITGTDIVRALVFRFEAFGRPVRTAMLKKFEEGVFSDLRNLKPGVDASLEEPKSPFLDLLFKYQCIRTQKKQKVFYWFSVPHDRLFLDALERDLKREKMGQEPTTVVTGEPAMSFTYDHKRSLYEQFSRSKEGEGELESAVRRAIESSGADGDGESSGGSGGEADDQEMENSSGPSNEERLPAGLQGPGTRFFSMFSLFEGSPTYKQRRKKTGSRGLSGLGRAVGDERRSVSVDGAAMDRDRGRRQRYDSLDSLGRDSGLSAADAFMVQARGRRDGLGHAMEGYMSGDQPGYDPLSVSSAFPGVSGSMVPRDTNLEQRGSRHTFPVSPPAGYAPHPYQALRPSTLPLAPSTSSAPYTQTMGDNSFGKTKAFVCPLFSCGRLFKRMEHLKRHLRTHTLERPYQCPRCKKRFSRSDNLNQHVRTHDRGGRYDDSEGGGGSGVESELDELDGSADGVNLGMYDDMQMCEVEVPGPVQDVSGDEEGLLNASAGGSRPYVNGQDVYFPSGMSGAQYTNDGAQYVTVGAADPGAWPPRSQSSPAFSSASAPSPSSNIHTVPQMRSGSSMSNHSQSGLPAPYLRQSPSPSLPSTMFTHNPDYITSMSAPSHKQHFEHSSLYPPVMGLDDGSGSASSGPGPVRRHRSMTPNLMRDADSGIRRPLTATSVELSGPGSRSGSISRGYHPYAMNSNGYASGGSTHSSPATYPISLDYQDHRPRSNSNAQLQDQMRAMMVGSGDVDSDMYGPSATTASTAAGYGEIYRTESPAPFQGGDYTNGSQIVAEPAMYGMGLDSSHGQYVPQDVGQTSGYYTQGHHVTM